MVKVTNKEVLQPSGMGKINIIKDIERGKKNYLTHEIRMIVYVYCSKENTGEKTWRRRRLEMMTVSFNKRKMIEIIKSSRKWKYKTILMCTIFLSEEATW